ncbi:hypothetical protein TDB9533_02517 [Thalassocella blandensis]|nr:hypothetical protein TDB9533_02517 [Thalassocella blandensis]
MFKQKCNLPNQVASQYRQRSSRTTMLSAMAYPVIIAGLLSGQAFAEDAVKNRQVKPVDQNQTMQQDANVETDELKSYRFSKADLNNDDKVNWAEIKINYGASLDQIKWDEKKIFTSYDKDNNTYLDEEEFSNFYTAMEDKKEIEKVPNGSLSANTNNSSQSMSKPSTQDLPHRVADDKAGSPQMQASAKDLPHRVADDNNAVNQQGEMDGRQVRAISSITASEQASARSSDGVRETVMTNNKDEVGTSLMKKPDASNSQPVTLTDTTGRLTVEKKELIDKDVYNLNGEHVGEVEDLVFNGSRGLQGAVVEVGGILGVGERDVFVHVSQLRYDRQGQKVVWQSMMTEDELDDLPEYDKDQISSANNF